MKDDKNLAYIFLDRDMLSTAIMICEVHDIKYVWAKNELIIDEENLSKLKYFIDDSRHAVPELSWKLQQAGKNKFGW